MNSRRKKLISRSYRPLTAEERRRVERARAESERERPEIVRQGKAVSLAWHAVRHDVDAIVAALRAERRRQGLSLGDIEQRSGLRKSALSRLENDQTSNPTLLTLHRYAAALGLSLKTTVTDAETSGAYRKS